MAFDQLKNHLAKSAFKGVGTDRIEVRTQGCWNCTHWDVDQAIDLWWSKARAAYLAKATQLAIKSPLGEEYTPVKNIRRMIPAIDYKMEARAFGTCKRGVTAIGEPVGHFVLSTYLCDRWTAAPGASVAREGKGPDKLVEELMEDKGLDGGLGSDPVPVAPMQGSGNDEGLS